MSRNGSGTYSLPTNSWNPATNGQLATTADWQSLINDVAAALTQSVSKDGQTVMTGSLDMGGFNLTNVASAAIGAITGGVALSGVPTAPTAAPGTNTTQIATTAFVNAQLPFDADQLDYTAAGTGAVTTNVQDKLRELRSVHDFGAVGDGVTDDTTALQNALNTNELVFVPPGKYRTTANLVIDPAVNRNCGFIGYAAATRYPYTQQSGGPTWNGQQESVIFYDGAVSTSAAVIAASAEAVGVEPASTFDTTLWTLVMRDVTLDANSKAGYGLYCARVQDLQLEHVRARGATVAGMSINGTYSGSAKNVRCYLNPGRGFELGAADTRWGWTVNDKVNAFYIYDLHCDANGSDSTFRQATPALLANNCGVYFGPHRSTHIYGVVSENNFGANIVFEPTSAGNSIHGVYTELGCKYAPGGAGTDAISLGYATDQLGVVFIGAAAAQNCRLADGVCATDKIWLTGTEPTASREESGFELYNISLAGGVIADWGNYRLVNCALELYTITGTQPVGAFTVGGGLQFGPGQDILKFYDEGTFTLTPEGSSTPGTGWTTSINAGSYTRIGQHCFFSGRIALTAIGAGAAGSILFKGLPFTVRNGNNYNSAMSISNVQNMTTAVVSLTGSLTINNTQFILYHRTAAAAGETQTGIANISGTLAFNYSGHYVIAP